MLIQSDTSKIIMDGKCDLSDFDCGVVVVVSEAADLLGF